MNSWLVFLAHLFAVLPPLAPPETGGEQCKVRAGYWLSALIRRSREVVDYHNDNSKQIVAMVLNLPNTCGRLTNDFSPVLVGQATNKGGET